MSASVSLPTLETARLVLRAPAESDAAKEFDFYASQDARFVGGPMSPEQVWRQQAAFLGHWHFRGYGFWAVESRETGDYLGHVGLWFPLGWPEREIGWTLMPHAQGKGFATEAALAARAHAYDVLGWNTAISLILPENEPSKAVARRLGARFESSFDHKSYGPVEIWRHLSPADLVNGGMEAYA